MEEKGGDPPVDKKIRRKDTGLVRLKRDSRTLFTSKILEVRTHKEQRH